MRMSEVVVLLFIAFFLVGFVMGEKRQCESLGREYSWDFGHCK